MDLFTCIILFLGILRKSFILAYNINAFTITVSLSGFRLNTIINCLITGLYIIRRNICPILCPLIEFTLCSFLWKIYFYFLILWDIMNPLFSFSIWLSPSINITFLINCFFVVFIHYSFLNKKGTPNLTGDPVKFDVPKNNS